MANKIDRAVAQRVVVGRRVNSVARYSFAGHARGEHGECVAAAWIALRVGVERALPNAYPGQGIIPRMIETASKSASVPNHYMYDLIIVADPAPPTSSIQSRVLSVRSWAQKSSLSDASLPVSIASASASRPSWPI